jgi:hypothetical protein
MEKYIVKKYFDGWWMIAAPGSRERALCSTHQAAIDAMETHIATGQLAYFVIEDSGIQRVLLDSVSAYPEGLMNNG